MPVAKFGTVQYVPLSGLKDERRIRAARLLVFAALGRAPRQAMEACEYGLADGEVVTLRVPDVMPELPPIPTDRAEGDPEYDTTEVCAECEEPIFDDAGDASECRVCNDLVCDNCQWDHESICDRWT